MSHKKSQHKAFSKMVQEVNKLEKITKGNMSIKKEEGDSEKIEGSLTYEEMRKEYQIPLPPRNKRGACKDQGMDYPQFLRLHLR